MLKVLDPCCGSRMFYFDKKDSRVEFGDIRELNTNLCDGRELVIAPDKIMDFRNLTHPDGTFDIVIFDPPHLKQIGDKSWMALKYGKLSENWKEDLSKGFAECFRVLNEKGVLIFKWNETQIKVSEILALTPVQPLIGHKSGKHSNTHWILFTK